MSESAATSSSEGLLPSVLPEILNQRKAVKDAIKAEIDKDAIRDLENKRDMLRIAANTMYGYHGSTFHGTITSSTDERSSETKVGIPDGSVQQTDDILPSFNDPRPFPVASSLSQLATSLKASEISSDDDEEEEECEDDDEEEDISDEELADEEYEEEYGEEDEEDSVAPKPQESKVSPVTLESKSKPFSNSTPVCLAYGGKLKWFQRKSPGVFLDNIEDSLVDHQVHRADSHGKLAPCYDQVCLNAGSTCSVEIAPGYTSTRGGVCGFIVGTEAASLQGLDIQTQHVAPGKEPTRLCVRNTSSDEIWIAHGTCIAQFVW